MLFHTFKQERPHAGQCDVDGVVLDRPFDDATGWGVQADFISIKIPPKGSVVRFDGPQTFAVGVQLEISRYPVGMVAAGGMVFSH